MSTIDVRAERRMSAPLPAVWGILEDLPRLPEWLAFAKEVEDVSSARAVVGARYVVTPHRSYEPTTSWTVTEVAEGRRQVHESEMPMISGVRSTIEVQDADGGAIVRVHWRGEPSKLASRLMRPVFQRRIQANWEASLVALDRLAAEAPAAAGGPDIPGERVDPGAAPGEQAGEAGLG
jgi:hypothetical protein